MWIPSAFALALFCGLLVYIALRRPPPELWPAIPVALATAIAFTAGDLATLFIRDPDLYWAALVVLYAGIIGNPCSWWWLSNRLARLHGLVVPTNHPTLLLAAATPSVGLFLAFLTNPWHGLFLEPVVAGGRNLYGPIWAVHAAWAYLLIGATLILNLRLARQASARARRAGWIMVGATLAPAVANLIYVLPPTQPPFDTTGVGMCVAAGLFLLGVRRHLLFALSPTALDALLAPLPTGHLLLDGGGRLLRWNVAAESILDPVRLSLDLDVYAALARVARDPDRPEAELGADALRRRLESARWPIDLALSDADGGRFVAARATRLGRSAGWSLQFEDRSALRRAEDALKQSEATLRRVIDRVPALIYARDETGRFLFANRAAASEADLSLDEILGRRDEMLSAEDQLALDREDTAVLRDDRVLVVPERWARDRRGRRRAFRLTKLPIRVPGESRRGVLTVADEITDLKHAESAVIRSQKLESLGLLAGGVAHDFNNLMAMVLANAELAAGELERESAGTRALEDVVEAARRASDLAGQLLAYAGAQPFEPRPVGLGRTARGVLKLLSAQIPASLVVDLDVAEPEPRVQADPVQLRQVVMNLVINAVEAMGEQPGRLTVRADLDPDTGMGRLTVRDTGPGVDPALRERIFDPFVSTRATGRGLGLAAVSGIVRRHGGSIQLDTAPDPGGAAFVVRLPLAAAVARPEAPPPVQPRPAEELPVSCVLVADDEPGMRRTLRRLLEARGVRVLEAADGREALALYERDPAAVDLVVLDVKMPGMDGREALARIRMHGADTPVLLSSGWTQATRAEDLGAPMLAKPYGWDDFLAAARKALGLA